MEPCGTPIIVCIHELKTEPSFVRQCQGNFLLVLDYHDLNHKLAVQLLLNHGVGSQVAWRDL